MVEYIHIDNALTVRLEPVVDEIADIFYLDGQLDEITDIYYYLMFEMEA